MDFGPELRREDLFFFLWTLAACGCAGWFWSLFEWFMRVDVHV